MLTTKSSDDELLTSRCMALAGKVRLQNINHMPLAPHPRPFLSRLTRDFPNAQEHGGIDLVFHTNLFSHKTMDLTTHPKEVNMSFLDPLSGSWASISGTASIISDRDTVKKYYSPALQAWLGDLGDGVHDGGPEDPRIGVIKLEAVTAHYALARKGMLTRAVETVKSVATGNVPAINSIRELSRAELEECKFSCFSSHFFVIEHQVGTNRE
ncbi:hypothetical protein BO86DRAFT_390053 [Aspergillus japonicus CBS 114.51]|uniref:General stress protein FMN-binding split barrel domain-containing protein n=1 Tax=Aspergillus japonicus CBS 114.51 TaxID=1448312 RepID=A0A8T8WXR6_ASPJA|nr:hypothetical protein BO86DRAFT_390053 [Aspergillus japonicus CBS 114.51]RAH80677.1 hypothetical protein BO86DRAFT_390053 [Aspergillus japonicus CBS 114.51]